MPQPRYLALFAAASLSVAGCAGANWFGAPPAQSPLARSDEPAPTATPTTAGAPATGANTIHPAAAIPHAPGAGGPLPSQASDPAEQALLAQVKSLGYDDPAEEAGALEALRSLPAGHREFLLRTMRASLHAHARNTDARPSPPSTELTAAHAPPNAFPGTIPTDDEAVRPAVYTPKHKPRPSGTVANDAQAASDVEVASRTASNNDSSTAEADAAARAGSRSPQKASVRDRSASTDSAPKASAHSGRTRKNGPGSSTIERVSHTGDDASENEEDWRTHLAAAIESLEADLKREPSQSRADQARLRLLWTVAGDKEAALRPMRELTAAEQDYWNEQIYALGTLLDDAKQHSARRRATEASAHLKQASTKLGESASLVVRNLAFCTEVKGFGIYSNFDRDEFKPGQEVLLYAELENFVALETDKGYHTSLRGSYQIFDSKGNRVAEKDFAAKEEYCQNRRRDFFVPYFLWLPKTINDGTYTLKLHIEDVHRQETAEGSIDFTVKEK